MPSIILSVVIVIFFAVVLFPTGSRRSMASTPRKPTIGPIVSGRPAAKPVPPIPPEREQVAASSTDPAARPPGVPGSHSGGLAEMTGIVETGKVTATGQPRSDPNLRRSDVPATPVGMGSTMGQTELRTARPMTTVRRIDPAGSGVRIASKESTRRDPRPWSLVPSATPAVNPGDTR